MNISTYGAGVKDQPVESAQIPTSITGILFRVKLSATIETIGGPMGLRKRFNIWVMLAVMVVLSMPAYGQSESDEEIPLRMARQSKWNLFIAPYGWLTGVSGTVVTDGEETQIDVPFEDFLENVNAGLMLYFEARRNKLILAFDGTWANLGTEVDGRLVDLDIEIKQRIYDIRIGYEVYRTEIGEVIHKPKFDWQRRGVIDLFIGGRYFKTEPIITVIPIIGDERVISNAKSRVDPFVGMRIAWDMSYRWGFAFWGDVGGFGIGNAAQFSWQATAEFGFRVSKRVTIFGGYRALDYDTIEGHGLDRNGTDLRQNGPIIGAGIRL